MRFTILLFALFAATAQAACPGTGIYTEDLAGTCVDPQNLTPGALQPIADSTTPTTTPTPTPAPAPGTTKIVTIPAVWLLEVFTDCSARAVAATDTYGHCIGRQKDSLCRAAITFPTDTIPKGTTITSASLKLQVVYSSAPSPYTWAISRYGGGDPRNDPPATALVKIDGERFISATTALRTTGAKTILITKAVPGLKAAASLSQPFSLGIKQNQENTPDRFTALSQTARPELLVTVKYP